MHGAECFRGMREPEDLAEGSPDGRLGVDPIREGRHGPFHAFLGVGRERQAMPADEFEEPHHKAGVGFEAVATNGRRRLP